MSPKAVRQQNIMIPCEGIELQGELSFSQGDGEGIVIFAHGSGSGRLSPRNKFVADLFLEVGLNTLLFDLLTNEEDILDMKTHNLRFDIPLLTKRLILVTEWIMNRPRTRGMSVGYFGASTGSAAALSAAASFGDGIHAIVSRGGRPDLAEIDLGKVKAPTLFIVGSLDKDVWEINQKALHSMPSGLARLEIVSGAGHLFEEEGALEKVAALSKDWFVEHLLGQVHPYEERNFYPSKQSIDGQENLFN